MRVTPCDVTRIQTGETSRISLATDGSQTDAFSNDPVLSADGRCDFIHDRVSIERPVSASAHDFSFATGAGGVLRIVP